MDIYKTIYIEADEEITEVVDRLREKDAKEIFLVVPQKAAILQSIVNLKILKEEAERLGKRVFIVTQDKIGRNLASRAGFITRREVDQRKKTEEPAIKEESPLFYPQNDYSNGFDRLTTRAGVGNIIEKKPLDSTGSPQAAEITVTDIIKSVKEARQKEEKEGVPIEVKVVKKHFGAISRKKFSFPLEKFSSKSFSKKLFIPTFDRKVFLIFFIATAIIVSLIVFIILPKAEINIISITEPLSLSIDVITTSDAKDINLNTYEIPAKVFTWEKEIKESFIPTGEEERGEKAKGEVNLYNETGNSITIIEGTRLQAKNGMIFRTQKKVSVPAKSGDRAGMTKVEVLADEGGELGNIGSEKFILVALPMETQNQIYAKNEKQFSGGTNQKVIKITDNDFKNAEENLKNKITEETKETLQEEIKKSISEDYIFLDQAFNQEIQEIKLDREVGAEADTFEARAKVVTKAIVYKKTDFLNLITAEVDAVLDKNKKIFEPHKNIRTEFKEFNSKEEKMKLTVFLEAVVVRRIDEIKLRDELAGKSSDEAVLLLKKIDGIKNAEVILSPFWVKRVPAIDKKIIFKYKLE